MNADEDTNQMLGEDEDARSYSERYKHLAWYWVDQRISGFWAAKYLLLLIFILFTSIISTGLLATALRLDTMLEYDNALNVDEIDSLWWLAWGFTVDVSLRQLATLNLTNPLSDTALASHTFQGPWHVETLASLRPVSSRPKVWCFFTATSGICSFMGILVMSSFLGVMVDLVERAPRGSSAIMEKGHHVILNWSGEIHFLIDQLGHAMESENGGTVVLLNTRPKFDQLKDLKTIARSLKRRGINLLIRQGNPRTEEDLKRVGVSLAKSVIMLSPHIADPLAADIECSHVILQISSVVDHTQVPIILELRDEESRLLVEAAARGR